MREGFLILRKTYQFVLKKLFICCRPKSILCFPLHVSFLLGRVSCLICIPWSEIPPRLTPVPFPHPWVVSGFPHLKRPPSLDSDGILYITSRVSLSCLTLLYYRYLTLLSQHPQLDVWLIILPLAWSCIGQSWWYLDSLLCLYVPL